MDFLRSIILLLDLMPDHESIVLRKKALTDINYLLTCFFTHKNRPSGLPYSLRDNSPKNKRGSIHCNWVLLENSFIRGEHRLSLNCHLITKIYFHTMVSTYPSFSVWCHLRRRWMLIYSKIFVPIFMLSCWLVSNVSSTPINLDPGLASLQHCTRFWCIPGN